MPEKIEISHRTIIFTVFFLLLLYLVYQILNIIITLFIAFLVMSALNPFVNRLESMKIPRILGAILVYAVILCFISLVIAGMAPPLVDQTVSFVEDFPSFLKDLRVPFVTQEFVNLQLNQFGSIPTGLVKMTVGFFNNLTSALIVSVISFYFLLERKNLDHYIESLFAQKHVEKVKSYFRELEKRLGGWVRAQVVLMVIVGLMCYIGLRFLRVDFALPLAILAGLLEVVPNIGPLLSAIPAVIMGFAISPMMGVSVAALYFLVQQLENALIVPQVMSKGIGLRPLVVIIAMAIGAKLWGVGGIILAIPLVIVLQVTVVEVFNSKVAGRI